MREPSWYTTLEVAQVLGVSVRTVERWRSEGKFTPSRSTKGGHSRYSLEQVVKMKEHKNHFLYKEKPRQPKKKDKPKIKKKVKIMDIVNTPCPFAIPSQEEFVKYVYDFLEKSNIKPSMFGRMVLNDSGSIQRLKEGTDPRLSTMLKICESVEKVKQDQALQKILQDMME